MGSYELSVALTQSYLENTYRIVSQSLTKKRMENKMSKCFECQDECTKDWKTIIVLSEDGNEMKITIHDECHKRALKGGTPVYPERKQP